MQLSTALKRALPITVMLCGLAFAEDPQDKAVPHERTSILLTKHENETIENQTVYLNGQAFLHCKFKACTLVIRESIYDLEGCEFNRCNFQFDMMVMWGDTRSHLRDLRALLDMIDKASANSAP